MNFFLSRLTTSPLCCNKSMGAGTVSQWQQDDFSPFTGILCEHPAPHFLIINLSRHSSQQPIYRNLHQTSLRCVLIFKRPKNKAETSARSPLYHLSVRGVIEKGPGALGFQRRGGVDGGGVVLLFSSLLSLGSYFFLLFYLFSPHFLSLPSYFFFHSLLHLPPQTPVCSSTPHCLYCDELIAVSSSECDGSPVL